MLMLSLKWTIEKQNSKKINFYNSPIITIVIHNFNIDFSINRFYFVLIFLNSMKLDTSLISNSKLMLKKIQYTI